MIPSHVSQRIVDQFERPHKTYGGTIRLFEFRQDLPHRVETSSGEGLTTALVLSRDPRKLPQRGCTFSPRLQVFRAQLQVEVRRQLA